MLASGLHRPDRPLTAPPGSVRIDSRVVSHGQAPTDSMTPTTKLAPPVPLPPGKGWRAVSASFSNFVVAGHRSDQAVAAIPFADVKG
jgi:hypothetical protein